MHVDDRRPLPLTMMVVAIDRDRRLEHRRDLPRLFATRRDQLMTDEARREDQGRDDEDADEPWEEPAEEIEDVEADHSPRLGSRAAPQERTQGDTFGPTLGLGDNPASAPVAQLERAPLS
jgi:hypothetical protein